MRTSRRSILGLLALAAPGAAVAPGVAAAQTGAREQDAMFSVPEDVVLLNNAGTHPLPVASAQAMTAYLAAKGAGHFDPNFKLFQTIEPARANFARLINADPEEVALVQSTLAAENFVVSGLNIPGSRGNVVTDALHYDGALYLYRSLETPELEVRIAPSREWGVMLEDLERLIDEDTKLVSVSLISSANGFTHDLKAICEIAHAKGALVYADVIQAVGVMPFDVKASNVDFVGCGSYKWLMGDCGAGFIYARKDLLGTAINRDHWGFLQCAELEQDPFSPPAGGTWPVRFERLPGAPGYFEMGTPAFGVLTGLNTSFDLIETLGVPAIRDHVGQLVDQLRRELPRLGYRIATPPGPGPIVAFEAEGSKALRARLAARNIDVKADYGLIRVSPAIFNTPADIERLLEALKS